MFMSQVKSPTPWKTTRTVPSGVIVAGSDLMVWDMAHVTMLAM